MSRLRGPMLFGLALLILATKADSDSRHRNYNGGKKSDDNRKPNIVMIIADDMGWNDVSFHGSDQIPTPNIDALAYNGVILNRHYVSAMCTPSRSALLTGKYPIRLGMQHLVILEGEPRGLPLSEKILPQYLKEVGYKTHAVGKWHLGFSRREYTPTYRGFDSHFGYWQGLQDYYTHNVASSRPEVGFIGFDMRRNMSVAWDTKGKYSTDLFTEEAERLIEEHDVDTPMFMYMAHLATHSGNDDDPLQAPDEEVAKFSYIKDAERRVYAAIVSKLDESVGRVVAALRRRGMLDNSIIIFMTDNGGATHGTHYNRASNYPLRGIKASPWEGGIRGNAAIWSPLIEHPKRVSDQMMYIADWLPTLFGAAGLELKTPSKIDGVNQWPSISRDDKTSPRTEFLVNIDPIFNYSAVRKGDFKYVKGSVKNGDEWYGETGLKSDRIFEGETPEYKAEKVLMSRAGTAISGLVTDRQVSELRRIRRNSYEKVEIDIVQILSPDELMSLRRKATVNCGVREEDKITCKPLESPCLFDIVQDPCEMINLAKSRPTIMSSMEEALRKYQKVAVLPGNLPNDPLANPKLWNDTWVNWQDPNPWEFLDTSFGDGVIGVELPGSGKLMGTIIGILGIVFGLAVVAICVFSAVSRVEDRKKMYPEPSNFRRVDTMDADADPECNGRAKKGNGSVG